MISQKNQKIIIIFIDHFAATFIAKQTDFNSFNIENFNLRLIKTFQYLFQFNLKITYKSGKIHLIFDAFNKFLKFMEKSHFNIFDDLTIKNANTKIFTAILIELKSEFRAKTVKIYAMEFQ